jgi:hypothetical protein
VRRDWSSAKIWLYREPTGETGDGLGSLEMLDRLLQSVLERPPEERDVFSGTPARVTNRWNAGSACR